MLNTLALAVLSASAAVSPLSHMPHLHPHLPAQDDRVAIVLENKTPGFIDLKINGQEYTILSKHHLSVKAPAGTIITSASTTYAMQRGQVIASLSPAMQNEHISLH